MLLASADLRLDTRYVSSDVDDFRNAVRHGDHERAVKLYSGPFLDGFHVRGRLVHVQQHGVAYATHEELMLHLRDRVLGRLNFGCVHAARS